MLKVVLRDLEGVLRKNFDDSLIVDDFKATSLLPPGENYGSTVFKVDAVIRRSKEADKEDLHLIAKMVPPSSIQREIFQSPLSFRKEIAMYEHILKIYHQLQLECGFKDNEIFEFGAKFYGSRLSLNPNVEFDENAVILLENLNFCGYFCGVRSVGYDLNKAKLILKTLARFHTLGIATKLKKPEEFAKIKIFSKTWDIKFDEAMNEFLKNLFTKLSSDSVAGKYSAKFDFIDFNTFADYVSMQPEEPWATIIHSDFWVNNMMLHVDENGEPDDVKFVDFQIYMYLNPLSDLIFFLFTSLDDDAREHLDKLIDFYYENFVGDLDRMGCDVSMFSREKFDKLFPTIIKGELIHCAIILKMITINIETDGADKTDMSNAIGFEGNELFFARLREMVVYFVSKGWL